MYFTNAFLWLISSKICHAIVNMAVNFNKIVKRIGKYCLQTGNIRKRFIYYGYRGYHKKCNASKYVCATAEVLWNCSPPR